MLYAHVVSAFEEVDVAEPVSGEEQLLVGFGSDVGVGEPELVVSSEQGKLRCI
jgi:hypothetical protein